MNLMKQFSKEEIKLLSNAGINVEDIDYNKEELRKYELEIEEFIMSHSTKNGDITKLNNQYNGILDTIINEREG